MDMWNDILSKGYDEIVYIPMSSGLSASCESAKIFPRNMTEKFMWLITTEFLLRWKSLCLMQ